MLMSNIFHVDINPVMILLYFAFAKALQTLLIKLLKHYSSANAFLPQLQPSESHLTKFPNSVVVFRNKDVNTYLSESV